MPFIPIIYIQILKLKKNTKKYKKIQKDTKKKVKMGSEVSPRPRR